MIETSKIQTACPACGSNNSKSTKLTFRHSSRGERTWRQCLSCKSFFDPIPFQIQEEIKHIETMPWGEVQKGIQLGRYKQKMYQAILHLLGTYAPPPKSILDVGCSFGTFLEEARKLSYSVYGFDIAPAAVDYVNSMGILAESSHSIENVFEGTLFQVITCLDVNIYWPDQPQELKKLRSKLTADGILVFRLVSKSWLFNTGLLVHKIAPKLGERLTSRAINDHRFSMPVGSFLRTLEQTGFKVIFTSPHGAQHSENSTFAVKLAFQLGSLFWRLTNLYIVPGVIVIAQKK